MTHLLYLLIGLALAAWRFGPDVLTALAVTDAQRRPVLPEVALIAWAATFRPSIHATHVTLLGLAISIATTLFLTDLFKDAIGRPRPDLIARCKARQGTPQHELVTVDVCTETGHHVLHDGWKSYPSGHSSFSFSGLGWLAMLLASQTHVLRPRANLATVLVCLAPLIGGKRYSYTLWSEERASMADRGNSGHDRHFATRGL